MQYYVVTQGRANILDRLSLRDRTTYGVDWMAFYASSNRDALRQWDLFKAGTHHLQSKLEAEAARYRAAEAGYAPVWEAERDAVAEDAKQDLVSSLAVEKQVLRETQAKIALDREALRQLAPAKAAKARSASRSKSTERRKSAKPAKAEKKVKRSAPRKTAAKRGTSSRKRGGRS
jgi:hypothetical protein